MANLINLFSGGFTPRSLPSLVSWYDFSDVGTLWKDTARTSPVTADGDIILGVSDKSGAGHHLSEATNGPTYKQAIRASKSVARFDGTNDTLSGTLPASAPLSIAAAFTKRSAPGAGTAPGLSIPNTFAAFSASGTSATDWLYFRNEATATVTLTGATANAWGVMSWVYASLAAVTVNYNRSQVGSFDPDNNYSGGGTLFLSSNASAWTDCDYGELIISTAAWSANARLQVEQYLAAKWATP